MSFWPGGVEDWIEPHFFMYGLLLVVTEHATSVNANVTDIYDNERSPLHILLSTHSE